MTSMTSEEQKALEELTEKLNDPVWRITSGALYKIIVKGDDQDEDEGLVLPFKPNRAQRRFIKRMHNRNIILKARQLGLTTLITILWLDTALFSKDPIRCAIVAQDKDAAESIFRGKVLFAYDNLPDQIREMFPLSKRTASEIEFAHNGASIKVATSVRSGTIHRLHISEFGKICAKYPDKAKEVITGSIPAVPKSGITVIESTAEGREGSFFEMTQRAIANQQKNKLLTERDYKLHFYAWWEAPEYQMDPTGVLITDKEHDYFNQIEAKCGCDINIRQRAWYISVRDEDFSGDPTAMWQEYPSYPDEAFQVSMEGAWYAEQMARVRREGRILETIPRLSIPVNTFWDLGRGDMTTVWFHQFHQMQHRFIRYYENSGEDLDHYAAFLAEMMIKERIVYGTHYIPHEADAKRLGENRDTNKSLKEIFESLLPGQRFVVVPRVTVLTAGINATRSALSSAWFDGTHCKQGLSRVENYRKRWNKTAGCWSDEEISDDNAHGADALRQWGQVVTAGESFNPRTSNGFKRRGSAMAR